jgi:hypothetical protein
LGSTVVVTQPAIPPAAPAAGTAPTRQSPATQVPAVAPLPDQLQTQISGGGTRTQSSLALSPGISGSGSPSEQAESRPGGGGKTLEDCMGFWEPETHMSKREWRAACLRTQKEHPTVR